MMEAKDIFLNKIKPLVDQYWSFGQSNVDLQMDTSHTTQTKHTKY